MRWLAAALAAAALTLAPVGAGASAADRAKRSGAASTQRVERWDIFEVALPGPAEGNPFAEVTISARFEHQGRAVNRVAAQELVRRLGVGRGVTPLPVLDLHEVERRVHDRLDLRL